MRKKENAVFSALQRADRFFDDNFDELSAAVDITSGRKCLTNVLASFRTHAVAQSAADRETKGASAKQQDLRVTLRTEQMQPIAEIARRNLRMVPEFKALRMPRIWITGPAFSASAKGMARAAALHKEMLIERGMPADFLDTFQASLAQLEECTSQRDTSRTRRMGATEGLRIEEQEGRSVLKVLDALVRRALKGNASLLATWAGARAIHRRPGVAAATPAAMPAPEAAPQAAPTLAGTLKLESTSTSSATTAA